MDKNKLNCELVLIKDSFEKTYYCILLDWHSLFNFHNGYFVHCTLYDVCTMYVQGMYNVYTRYVQCMYKVCTMYVQCMHIVKCMYSVYTVYVKCMYNVCTMYNLCTM